MTQQHPRHLHFTGADGNRLAADGYGHGPQPVVLLHGGGQTRHAWRGTARKLADLGLTAIPVDLRGHGDSEWDPKGRYRFHDYGRDVLALARQVEAEFGRRAIAVGASLGGISSLYAQEEAQAFQSLVLVDIVPKMSRQGVDHIQSFMRAKASEGFATVEEAADAVAHYLSATRARPPSVEGLRKNLRQHEDGRWRWHWDPLFMDGPNAVGQGAPEFLMGLDERCGSFAEPVLLVHGASSDLVSKDEALDFVGRLRNGHYVDVSGAGHMVVGDKNDIFASVIAKFLS